VDYVWAMSSPGWVFVTGASTGIGRAAVERLVCDGFQVIAGVRKNGDQPAASTASVIIDVANGPSVEAATAQVLEISGGRLFGLVNNAGISVAGPFEALALADYRRQFDVNFFGQIDVTVRLTPSLLDTRGRIVNIGSIGGRVAAPFIGAYAASKFALRGWNDAMRMELAPHGIKVVLVQPGAISTEIWGKGNTGADEVLGRMGPEMQVRYASQVAGVRKTAAMVEKSAIPASKVADVISKALTAKNPRAHVLVGVDARVQAAVGVLPTRASDRVFGVIMSAPKGS
jgi:NAD(P)-dependent dehydrogenase (short-subunit alcohol dehydrogenase family)